MRHHANAAGAGVPPRPSSPARHHRLAVGLAGLLAVTTVGATVPMAASALAAPAPAALTLVSSVTSRTIERYAGEPFYPYDLGLAVVAGDSTFEVRTKRPSYSKPVVATRFTGTGSARKGTVLPTGLTTDVNTLTDFFSTKMTDSRGKVVSSGTQAFCPNSYDAARARPDAAPRSPFPLQCGYHPFAIGNVMGIQAGWSVSAAGYDFSNDGQSYELPDGTYTYSMAITPAYRKAFGLPAATSKASVKITIVTVDNPWDKGTAPAATARTLGAHATHAASPTLEGLSPQQTARELARRRTLGVAETPAAKAPTTATARAAVATAVPSGPKPDLRALPATDLYLSDGSEETGVPSGRTYLTFGATIWNAGPSPLVVDGFRRTGTDLMDAYQYFFDAKGNQVGYTSAGTLEWDPRTGHQHWHFTAFGTYRLLDSTRTKAVRSDKEAFCLAATDPVDLTLKGAEFKPGSTDLHTACGGQGALSIREQLDPGWGDTYGQYLPGQSFDVTDVPGGTYYVEVSANPDKKLTESSTTNNTALRKVLIGGKPGGVRTITVPPVGLIAAP